MSATQSRRLLTTCGALVAVALVTAVIVAGAWPRGGGGGPLPRTEGSVTSASLEAASTTCARVLAVADRSDVRAHVVGAYPTDLLGATLWLHPSELVPEVSAADATLCLVRVGPAGTVVGAALRPPAGVARDLVQLVVAGGRVASTTSLASWPARPIPLVEPLPRGAAGTGHAAIRGQTYQCVGALVGPDSWTAVVSLRRGRIVVAEARVDAAHPGFSLRAAPGRYLLVSTEAPWARRVVVLRTSSTTTALVGHVCM